MANSFKIELDRELIYEALARDYGLELVMEQNDVTDEMVIAALDTLGMIEIEDYFYTEVKVEDGE
jgi:hypothetical protein